MHVTCPTYKDKRHRIDTETAYVGPMRMGTRVRSADPDSAELADVALCSLKVLSFIWRTHEKCLTVASRYDRLCMAIAVADPAADLLTAIDAAHGLRDLHDRYPEALDGLLEVADRIDARAWARERARLGAPAQPERSQQ